jgi:hypothetical protein
MAQDALPQSSARLDEFKPAKCRRYLIWQATCKSVLMPIGPISLFDDKFSSVFKKILATKRRAQQLISNTEQPEKKGRKGRTFDLHVGKRSEVVHRTAC